MAYIDKLKNTGNALSEMRMEEKECLQKDIWNLRFENQSIAEKIRMLEHEFVDTDSEEWYDEEGTESNKSKEKEKLWNKCDECDFRCERETPLKNIPTQNILKKFLMKRVKLSTWHMSKTSSR